MSKGVWIVEELAPFDDAKWRPVEGLLSAIFERRKDAMEYAREQDDGRGWKYRAVHYSPTPRRRGKK